LNQNQNASNANSGLFDPSDVRHLAQIAVRREALRQASSKNQGRGKQDPGISSQPRTQDAVPPDVHRLGQNGVQNIRTNQQIPAANTNIPGAQNTLPASQASAQSRGSHTNQVPIRSVSQTSQNVPQAVYAPRPPPRKPSVPGSQGSVGSAGSAGQGSHGPGSAASLTSYPSSAGGYNPGGYNPGGVHNPGGYNPASAGGHNVLASPVASSSTYNTRSLSGSPGSQKHRHVALD